jgi:hypothetical protein
MGVMEGISLDHPLKELKGRTPRETIDLILQVISEYVE